MKRDDFMTVPELAEYLQVHPVTIYRLMKRKQIHPLRVGKKLRFPREAVEQWLADRDAMRNR